MNISENEEEKKYTSEIIFKQNTDRKKHFNKKW